MRGSRQSPGGFKKAQKFQNGLTGLSAKLRCKFIPVADDAIIERTLGVANSCASVGDRAGGQAVVLQKRQTRKARRVSAATGIVKNAQQRPCRQGETSRTQATVGAADSNAACVCHAQFGDGVNDPQGIK